MSELPFLSVCIPVYNGAEFIRKAVASVLTQDYPRFELNVCENVSHDGTREILSGISDPRLRVVNATEHVPLAANLNRAAALASGEWVLVLSADDELLPGALRIFGEAVLKYPEAEVIVGRASYLVEGSGRTLERGHYRHEAGMVPDFERFVVGNPFPVNINSMLLRKDLARFREDCGVVADLDMMIRFGIERRKVALLEEMLIHYRVHAGATSANRLKMFRESLAVYRDYIGKTANRPLFEMRIFRTLVWCVIYLKDLRDGNSAREFVKEFGPLVGPLRRCALKAALLVPWRLSAMEKIRAMRAKLIRAN